MAPLPHWVTIAFSLMATVGTIFSIYAIFKPKDDAMTKRDMKLAQIVVGHEVQSFGPGIGQEIVNAGSGNGAEVSVVAPSGTSVIGTRVIQSGPGIGMRVVTTGSGTGFKSTVVVGPKE